MGAKAMSGSAMTSVNSSKVPALFRNARKYGLLVSGQTVLDFGCGRWPSIAADFLAGFGAHPQSYDPAWQPHPERLLGSHYDVVCVSNVLNVIEDDAERRLAVSTAWGCVKPGGRMIVSVYEADRSGESGATTKGWQERRTLSSYAANELSGIPGRIMFGRLWVSDPKKGDPVP